MASSRSADLDGGVPRALRPVRSMVESDSEPTTTSSLSFALPLSAAHSGPAVQDTTDGVRPAAGQTAGDPAQLLFTPAQAAHLLQVRESWLRRRAARRLVPCTFLGKHLRFSRDDLERIAARAARPADTGPVARTRPSRSRPSRQSHVRGPDA
jgi:hypothetical protein